MRIRSHGSAGWLLLLLPAYIYSWFVVKVSVVSIRERDNKRDYLIQQLAALASLYIVEGEYHCN